jgi:hypothetical protein
VNKSEQWTISTKQQFASSSWITCGEGKDGVEQSARSGASVKRSRSRAKRSTNVEGKVVEATACSRGEAIEGALRRRRCAPGVGGVEVCSISGRGGGIEDLKRTSGEKLLSVERVVLAPDIYIGGQMRNAR